MGKGKGRRGSGEWLDSFLNVGHGLNPKTDICPTLGPSRVFSFYFLFFFSNISIFFFLFKRENKHIYSIVSHRLRIIIHDLQTDYRNGSWPKRKDIPITRERTSQPTRGPARSISSDTHTTHAFSSPPSLDLQLNILRVPVFGPFLIYTTYLDPPRRDLHACWYYYIDIYTSFSRI